jgi:hypothetical protein
MFGKNKPEAEAAAKQRQQKDSRRRVCSRVFGVFQTTGKHTADCRFFRVCGRFSGVQTTDKHTAGFGFSGLQFRFFRCSRRQANKQQGFRFSAEFRILQQICFRSSEGSDGDLDALDKNKRRASSGSRRTGPPRASSRRRRWDRRKDATSEAKRSKRSPKRKGNYLAEGGSTARGIRRGFSESERTKQANSRVKKWKDIGPSDAEVWVGHSGRAEQNTVAKFDVIGSSSSEAMPKKPPTARWIGKRSIIRVAAKEMTAATAVGVAVGRCDEGLGKINLN